MSLRERLGLEHDPILLVDGSAYVFRSFYANQNMSRSDGMPTNVLYMVLRLLLKILREESPAYLAFILDGRGKNFRHELYPEYKAHRMATPEPLSMQIPPLCEAVEALGLFNMFSNGCEADDCIASLAARFGVDHPVVIVGADKDLKQCLGPNVSIWDPSGKEERITTLASFVEEQGFQPEFWPDYQAIVGDSSDNIPGVPGIGAKGAGTLMREFAGLDDIEKRLNSVPPALRKKLEGNIEKAYLSRRLTTLKRDVCTDVTLQSLAPKAPNSQRIMEMLSEYELRSLARELASMLRINSMAQAEAGKGESAAPSLTTGFGPSAATVEGIKADNAIVNNAAPQKASVPAKKDKKNAASSSFAWAQGSLLGNMSMPSTDESTASHTAPDALPVFEKISQLPADGELALVLAKDAGGDKNDNRLIIGSLQQSFLCPVALPVPVQEALARRMAHSGFTAAGVKSIWEALPGLGTARGTKNFDLSLAAWLLSPEEYDYTLPKLMRRWGMDVQALHAEQKQENSHPCANMLALKKIMQEKLDGSQLTKLMHNMEMPLASVLLDMQIHGIGIDKAAFAEFLTETTLQLEALTKAIYTSVGQEFNIRSARQLGEVLFTVLGLKQSRKTSGGQASTSQESLEKLSGKHPVIDLILEYRKLEKLRSTYLEPLPKLADANGRLHTSFNQSSTATGRLSSSNPNLQNIPVRGPQGKRMRACFTAAEGNLLVSADYSQIELRVLAHLSADPTLLDAFNQGQDIHQRTASLLFDVPADEITADQRRSAKTINFGLIYGMGPQKLAQDLKMSLAEAKAFIERYFSRLGKLKEYFETVEKDAKTHGFVSTMTGRRRPCPEILSANQQLRSRARRQAINTCIQGSAADIIKLAMLAAAEDNELKSLGAIMILQIHDELVLECPAENAEKAGEQLAALMAGVKPGGVKLSVPLSCDWGVAKNWNDAH